jgi:hypothetical protein
MIIICVRTSPPGSTRPTAPQHPRDGPADPEAFATKHPPISAHMRYLS